jgi:chromosome segregation ATPase
MGQIGSDLTKHPEFTRWLKTQPADADLETVAASYVAVADQHRALRDRLSEGRRRIEAIDLAVDAATAKESDQLLRERATIAAELESLPRRISAVNERLTTARLAWLAGMERLALAEVDVCAEALIAPTEEGRTIRRRFERDESGTVRAESRTPPEQAETMRQRLTALATETRPIVDRAEAARLILGMIRLFTEQSGPRVVLANPLTWLAAA